MKIVNISTEDYAGGAGRACYRLHKAFQNLGTDSCLVALNKTVNDESVVSATNGLISRVYSKFSYGIDQFSLRSYPQRKKCAWSPGVRGIDVSKLPQVRDADAIILYWVAGGYLTPKIIRNLARLSKPIFWRLSDMWPFTGGCHYSDGCEKYTAECGECHLLNSSVGNDPSRKGISTRKRMWAEMKLNVICPSDWIADCAKRSTVFRDQPIRVVRTGVDTLVFRSAGRATARRVLGLPEDREIVLIGSVNVYGDPRKGGREAEETIRRIADRRDRSKLLVACFGSLNTVFEDTGVEVRNFGVLADDISLALLYSAADVFVAPSKEENLANTVLESLACGTPVVSFSIGGMPDAIIHKKSGYLAKAYDVEDFAEGIEWALAEDWHEGKALLQKQFSLATQASTYLKFIRKALHEKQS